MNNVIQSTFWELTLATVWAADCKGQKQKQADWGGDYGTYPLWKEQGLYNHT